MDKSNSNYQHFPVYETGNKIKIKDKNKGSFTRYCGGNVTEECIRKGKNSNNPKIRKKAIFAQNARKWAKKGQYGTDLTFGQTLKAAEIRSQIQKYQKGNKFDEDIKRVWKLRNSLGHDHKGVYEYLKYWGFKKLDPHVERWFNQYLNSEGIKRILRNQENWWKSGHPYRKWYSSFDPDNSTQKWLNDAANVHPYSYTADMGTDFSFVRQQLDKQQPRILLVGRNQYDESLPFNFVAGHEMLHGKTPYWFQFERHLDPDSAQYEAIQMNQNTKQDGHDNLIQEKHADNWGLKYLLYYEGIYDARKDKDITIDQIQQLRKNIQI